MLLTPVDRSNNVNNKPTWDLPTTRRVFRVVTP
nr:MAG TPA_asm: hypothetical protein [Caudoviricetes sp.]